MEMADFLAACFWPFIIAAGIVLTMIRHHELYRRLLVVTVTVGLASLFLLMLFDKHSIVAVIDIYAAAVVFGLSTIGYALFGRLDFSPFLETEWRDRLKEIAARIFMLGCGAGLAGLCGTWLVLDAVKPFLVLEGRVTDPRVAVGRRHTDYLVEIDGRTVNVTIPVYQRLKSLPVVRAEVGRGSNYIYRIEYLSN